MSHASDQSVGLRALSRPPRDPQTPSAIPRPRYRWTTRVLLPLGIVAGIVILLTLSAGQSLTPALDVSASIVIERETSSSRSGGSILQAAGWLEADPYLRYVTAQTAGVVAEVLVLEGDLVSAGQVVARLLPEDAHLGREQARAEVANREALLEGVKAHLRAAQTDWDNPIESRRAVDVATANLAESRSLRVQTEAEIRAATADLERLGGDLDRIASLGESRVVSDSELMNTRKRFEAQQATVEALRARTSVIDAQIARLEAEQRAANEQHRLRTAERRELDAAKAAVSRAEAELSAARVSLATAQLRVDRLNITSDTSGVVVQRFVEPGGKVVIDGDEKHSATIVSLYDPALLQVRVDVPLANAASIAINQLAQITVEVLPDRVFEGRVSRILHVADIQKNTLQAKVTIDESSPQLRPEMLARVRFMETAPITDNDQKSTALYIPRTAINGDAVWVVERFDGSVGNAALRTIQTGNGERDGWIEVREGLHPGDLVVNTPPPTIRPRARLRVTMASP